MIKQLKSKVSVLSFLLGFYRAARKIIIGRRNGLDVLFTTSTHSSSADVAATGRFRPGRHPPPPDSIILLDGRRREVFSDVGTSASADGRRTLVDGRRRLSSGRRRQLVRPQNNTITSSVRQAQRPPQPSSPVVRRANRPPNRSGA